MARAARVQLFLDPQHFPSRISNNRSVLIGVDCAHFEFSCRGRFHSNEKQLPRPSIWAESALRPVLYIVFTPCSSATKSLFSLRSGPALKRSRHPPVGMVGQSLQTTPATSTREKFVRSPHNDCFYCENAVVQLVI